MKTVRKNQEELDKKKQMLNIAKVRVTPEISPEEMQRGANLKLLSYIEQQNRMERLKSAICEFTYNEILRQEHIKNESSKQAEEIAEVENLNTDPVPEPKDVVMLYESFADMNNFCELAITLMYQKENNDEFYAALNKFISMNENVMIQFAQEMKILKFVALFSKITSKEEAEPIIQCLQQNLIPILKEERSIKGEAATNFVMLKILSECQQRWDKTLQNPDEGYGLLNDLLIVRQVLPFFLDNIRLLCFGERMNNVLNRYNEVPEHTMFRAQLNNNIDFFYGCEFIFHSSYIEWMGKSIDKWQKDNKNHCLDVVKNVLNMMSNVYNVNLNTWNIGKIKNEVNWVNMLTQGQDVFNADTQGTVETKREMATIVNDMVAWFQYLNGFRKNMREKLVYLPNRRPGRKNAMHQQAPTIINWANLTPPRESNMQLVPQANGNRNNNQHVLLGPQK